MKQRKTLTKEEDMVVIDDSAWETFRDTAHDQLAHIAVSVVQVGELRLC